MAEGVVLREYRASDLDAICRLDVSCFSEAFQFDRASMKRYAERRAGITLIAETDHGEICGFVIIHLNQDRQAQVAYVVTLDVACAFRRRGVATQLTQEAERRVALMGAWRMELHVLADNEGAVRFYERLGFEKVGEQQGFYGRAGLDALVYRKRLTDT